MVNVSTESLAGQRSSRSFDTSKHQLSPEQHLRNHFDILPATSNCPTRAICPRSLPEYQIRTSLTPGAHHQVSPRRTSQHKSAKMQLFNRPPPVLVILLLGFLASDVNGLSAKYCSSQNTGADYSAGIHSLSVRYLHVIY